MDQMPVADSGVPKRARGAKKEMILKKIDLEAAKYIQSIKDKANKKPFGRKVRDSEIILKAVRLMGDAQVQELQEATYSEEDRLKIAHQDYQKANGKVALDVFIGKLLRGELKPHAEAE